MMYEELLRLVPQQKKDYIQKTDRTLYTPSSL